MKGRSSLGQQLVGMSSGIERKVLWPDGTVRRYGLLELVVEIGHAHGEVLGMHPTLGLLILASRTDGRTRAV